MTTTADSPVNDRFAAAREVADAMLFEGYVLYPYRASAAKNQLRWQFGVLVPSSGQGAPDGEHSHQRTECLMEPRGTATLTVELRFLHAQRRIVQRVLDDGSYEDVPALELPDRVLVPWDEGVEERVSFEVPAQDLTEGDTSFPVHRPAAEETETVEVGGRMLGRLVRRREPLTAQVRLSAHPIPGPYRVFRLAAVVENTTKPPASEGGSGRALSTSLISTHVLLGLSAGSFLSLTDPPQWAKAASADCHNEHTWPVLIGEEGRADVVLSSPIILEDHPRIAPESPGALYDSTEIDEILALRTTALTEQEKREARGTDPRAGAVIDLADSMPPEVWDRLHGAVRALREVTGPDAVQPGPLEEPLTLTVPGGQPAEPWWDPASDRSVDPETDTVLVDGVPLGAGSRVRLRPGKRRTDAQDLFLHGRAALVEAVLLDVDGGTHLAVTVDGDPGADVRREQGRFLYFQPDEVEPLGKEDR